MESVENAISKVLHLKIFRGKCPLQAPYKFATSVLTSSPQPQTPPPLPRWNKLCHPWIDCQNKNKQKKTETAVVFDSAHCKLFQGFIRKTIQ